MYQASSEPRRRVFTILSATCLALVPPWAVVCYLTVANARPENWLAGLAGIFIAAVGCCVLSLLGAAFGIAAVSGSGRKGWATLALASNALVFLGTGVPLLMFLGPLR